MPGSDLVLATSIFGNYDTLHTPGVVANVPHICLTDRPQAAVPPWKSVIVSPGQDDRRLNAYHCKILVHRYLDAKIIIWVDANLSIKMDPLDWVGRYLARHDIAVPKHPYRDCVYQEAEACIMFKRFTPSKQAILDQVAHYRAEGYPEHNGMIEGPVFLRRMTSQVKEFCERWWEEAMRFSSRMQLSFNYLMWKLNMQYEEIPLDSYLGSIFKWEHLEGDP